MGYVFKVTTQVYIIIIHVHVPFPSLAAAAAAVLLKHSLPVLREAVAEGPRKPGCRGSKSWPVKWSHEVVETATLSCQESGGQPL